MSQREVFDAISAGNRPQLEKLLADDPTLADARDDTGVSAILHAQYNRRSEMIEALLKVKTDLDVFESAALGDAKRLAAIAAENPEQVNAWSTDGFTPLHLASYFGQLKAAQTLLQIGAHVNPVSNNQMKLLPLHSAAASRSADIVQLLLDNGADVNAQQHGGWTALHAAAGLGDPNMTRMLLNKGANPSLGGDDGKKPLDLANLRGHGDVAAMLLQAGSK
jgi:ankyrin repeat protein